MPRTPPRKRAKRKAPCRNWQKGFCQFGEKCWFAHDQPDPGPSSGGQGRIDPSRPGEEEGRSRTPRRLPPDFRAEREHTGRHPRTPSPSPPARLRRWQTEEQRSDSELLEVSAGSSGGGWEGSPSSLTQGLLLPSSRWTGCRQNRGPFCVQARGCFTPRAESRSEAQELYARAFRPIRDKGFRAMCTHWESHRP